LAFLQTLPEEQLVFERFVFDYGGTGRGSKIDGHPFRRLNALRLVHRSPYRIATTCGFFDASASRRPNHLRPVCGCAKVDSRRFALAVSIRAGLEARSRLDNAVPLIVSDEEDKSSQGASI
jgi:hypothetical protein